MTLTGPLIGLATFLIIGAFHPVVIKTEYYCGTRPWWFFLVAGIGCIAAALFVSNVLGAAVLGVTGFRHYGPFSSYLSNTNGWRKGGFPKGPDTAKGSAPQLVAAYTTLCR